MPDRKSQIILQISKNYKIDRSVFWGGREKGGLPMAIENVASCLDFNSWKEGQNGITIATKHHATLACRWYPIFFKKQKWLGPRDGIARIGVNTLWGCGERAKRSEGAPVDGEDSLGSRRFPVENKYGRRRGRTRLITAAKWCLIWLVWLVSSRKLPP